MSNEDDKKLKSLNLPAVKKPGGGISKKIKKPMIPPLKNLEVSRILSKGKSSLQAEIAKKEQGLDLVLVGDLTGSMQDYHELLKKQFASLSRELFQMIKNLKMSIIFYLDHDDFHPYVTKVCQLTKDINKMEEFIISTPVSGGGDYDEAVEDAFYDIVNLNWREIGNRSVILFGDARPHEPEDCPLQHSYFNLVQKMYEKKIIVNSVFCGPKIYDDLQKREDTPVGDFSKKIRGLDHPNFFSWVANVTGGMIIGVDRIDELIDIIKAAAAKDSGELEKYEESLKLSDPKKLKLLEITKKANKRLLLAQKNNLLGHKK